MAKEAEDSNPKKSVLCVKILGGNGADAFLITWRCVGERPCLCHVGHHGGRTLSRSRSRFRRDLDQGTRQKLTYLRQGKTRKFLRTPNEVTASLWILPHSHLCRVYGRIRPQGEPTGHSRSCPSVWPLNGKWASQQVSFRRNSIFSTEEEY